MAIVGREGNCRFGTIRIVETRPEELLDIFIDMASYKKSDPRHRRMNPQPLIFGNIPKMTGVVVGYAENGNAVVRLETHPIIREMIEEVDSRLKRDTILHGTSYQKERYHKGRRVMYIIDAAGHEMNFANRHKPI